MGWFRRPSRRGLLHSLRDYLELLRREGELCEVQAPVNPYLEVAEIHRRVIAAGGPALLFTSVGGSRYPVVTNLLGSQKRIELAFGERPLAFVREAVRAIQEALPPRPAALWRFRGLLGAALRLGLSRRRWGPVLEECDQPPRLDELPVLTASRSTTPAPPACTGRSRRGAASTTPRPSGWAARSR